MKEDKFFWNYKNEPGKKLINRVKYANKEPKVSIITSYYNSHEYMWQTINCVFNQTFPYWEWIIVDDGSTNAESIKYLNEVEKLDERIHVYHKENEGLAKGRDYAIKYSNTNYILPLDADDLIEPTYIEALYWALETSPNATWAFSNSLGFGKYIYLVDQIFDSEKMKTENQITATALIRKEKMLDLGGYGVAKRYVNEDWHLWLRMLARGDYPIQATFYGFWYRRRKESLLSEINDDKKEENNLRLRDLKIEADKITKKVEAKVYPKQLQNIEISKLEYNKLNWDENLYQESSENTLYIIPNTGMDKKLFKKIKIASKKTNVIVITLENSNYSSYALRQKYEEFSTVFSLPTFLEPKYFQGFIEYIINTRKIKKINVVEDYKDMEILQNRKVEKIQYKHNKILYKLKICEYKLKKSLPGRAIGKFIRIIKRV